MSLPNLMKIQEGGDFCFVDLVWNDPNNIIAISGLLFCILMLVNSQNLNKIIFNNRERYVGEPSVQ